MEAARPARGVSVCQVGVCLDAPRPAPRRRGDRPRILANEERLIHE